MAHLPKRVDPNVLNHSHQVSYSDLQGGTHLGSTAQEPLLNINTHTCTMLGFELTLITEERDLGVAVDSSLKISPQCTVATREASKILGTVKKGAETKTVFLCSYIQSLKGMSKVHSSLLKYDYI